MAASRGRRVRDMDVTRPPMPSVALDSRASRRRSQSGQNRLNQQHGDETHDEAEPDDHG
jgi:hypothetical protein